MVTGLALGFPPVRGSSEFAESECFAGRNRGEPSRFCEGPCPILRMRFHCVQALSRRVTRRKWEAGLLRPDPVLLRLPGLRWLSFPFTSFISVFLKPTPLRVP